MYPVSARFLAALVEDHTPVFEAVLFRTDGKVETLPVLGGSVPVDRKSACRRTCSMTTPDVSLIPRTAADKLSVYGATIRLSRGVQFADGSRELAPLGVFRLDEVSGDVDAGPVALNGKSLECVVSDDKFLAPYRVQGTAVGAITALIRRSIPDAAVVSRVTDAAIGARTYDIEADPWTAVVECGAAIGAEVYCDAEGAFIIADLPDLLTATPVWTVAAGEGGALVTADRGMSVDGVFNAVLARGDGTEAGIAPVSYLATDDDPFSPTYWGGPFGHRPTFYSSSTLTSTAAAQAAAILKLRSARAANATADLSSLPNPALDPGDVLVVAYEDGSRELHQVASFTVPMELGGAFSIRTISAREDG